MKLEISYWRWREEYKSILSNLSDRKNMVLFSGGKDSSLALDFILRASREFGFDFEAHASIFPVHRYSEAGISRLRSYWTDRGVEIIWHEPAITDHALDEAINPCIACQTVNKNVLNGILSEGVENWDKLIVIAGYSLWDIVSYVIENVLNSVSIDSDEDMRAENERRLIETAQRFYPILKMDDGYTVFRPLIKVNTTHILQQIEKIGIPVLSIPCKHQQFRPKRYLMNYYEKMGMSFDYERVLRYAKKLPNFPDIDSYTSIDKREYFSNIF